MSTKRMNNNRKNQLGNILIIATIVLLVVLVAIIIIANGSEARKVSKIFDSYTEAVYGQKEDISAEHYVGDGANYWVAGNYAYYVDDNIIYDYARTTELNTSVTEAINNYISEKGEDYSLMTAQYYIYTDASDVTKDYAGLMVYYIASATDTYTQDEAAEFISEMLASCGDVTFTGLDINFFDSENEYYFSVDPFEGNEITLESLKENVTVAEEKSTLYAVWQANLALANAADNIEVVEGEADSAE